MEPGYPKVQIVDENDNVIGSEYLFDAIKMNAIRRASRIFVFDADGNFLIQKRSASVIKPLLFDQSVGGHVDEGETYYDAAVREMKEEIGLENCELKEIVTSYKTLDFFNTIYTTQVDVSTEIKFDSDEIDCVSWLPSEEVDSLVTETPELCTKGFVQIWKEFRGIMVK